MKEVINDEERRLTEEGERMIAAAKEFSGTFRALLVQVADIEMRLVDLTKRVQIVEQFYGDELDSERILKQQDKCGELGG